MTTCITSNFKFEYMERYIENDIICENHCHGRYEMLALLEGDINIKIQGNNYRLTQNHVIIIPPQIYHSVIANQNGTYRRVAVLFDLSAVPAVLQHLFTSARQDVTVFTSNQINHIVNLCQKENPLYYEPLLHSLMVQLFYLHSETATPLATNEKTDEFLQKILDYIDEHLHENITLDHLATHFAHSKYHISHYFKEKMGIPPKKYILQKKLSLAQAMINEGTPPTLVASQLGFEYYSTFYRIYKQYFSAVPSVGNHGDFD